VTALSKYALRRKVEIFTAALTFAGVLALIGVLVALHLPACSETPGFPIDTAVWEVAANAPLISPAIAAAATIAFDLIPTFYFLFGFARPRDSATPPEVDQMLCCMDHFSSAAWTAFGVPT